MEKSVVLRDGSVLQIFRPRGENAAEILEYLKTIGGETHFLLMDENGLGISEEEERLILEENLKQERVRRPYKRRACLHIQPWLLSAPQAGAHGGNCVECAKKVLAHRRWLRDNGNADRACEGSIA